ncbi:disease resistance protein RPS6-like [Quercus suber]|uniref:disease resistance protein RPS6-like n=1 Tax=Quercus suber TaxID=58331 RepID=UPI0032DEC6E2
MTPNITNLILKWCTNLVEIDDSVGRLDKLEVWDLDHCTKLETLPNCLTMKSLIYFNLEGCYKLKKFPNILHEMKGVKYLILPGTCANELPPSFTNFIGLKGLTVGLSHTGEAHLSGIIYNLQHIEWLTFDGNFIFPKNVEIDRQPMCNSHGCSSKCVFPMLEGLRFFGNKICSEIEFILNYCCPLTLEVLEIHKSKVVTLPKSMSRCERLHTLYIEGCDELREILRLPHSMRLLAVEACHSLDLQSFIQLLPEIIGLPPNLPPCLGVTSHMLMFPHSSTKFLESETDLCEYRFEVTGDKNDIPNWFNHQLDGDLISFSIGPEFPTIALCVAFELQDSCYDFDCYVFVSINGSERMFERTSVYVERSFGHLFFSCRPQSSLQEQFRDLKLSDRNHLEILCETFPHGSYDPSSREIAPIVKRIGVHVECNCPPPPQNPRIYDSKVVTLPESMSRFERLHTLFILNYCWPLTLEELGIYDSKVVTLPESMSRFDLGSSSVAQPIVKRKSKKRKRKVRPRFGTLFKQQFPLFKKRKRKV